MKPIGNGLFPIQNTKTIFEKIPPKKGDLDTIANINSALDNWSNSMSDRIFYIGLLPLGIAHTTLSLIHI